MRLKLEAGVGNREAIEGQGFGSALFCWETA
jgi:hypothetical protein